MGWFMFYRYFMLQFPDYRSWGSQCVVSWAVRRVVFSMFHATVPWLQVMGQSVCGFLRVLESCVVYVSCYSSLTTGHGVVSVWFLESFGELCFLCFMPQFPDYRSWGSQCVVSWEFRRVVFSMFHATVPWLQVMGQSVCGFLRVILICFFYISGYSSLTTGDGAVSVWFPGTYADTYWRIYALAYTGRTAVRADLIGYIM